jgi:ribosome-associated protein
VAYHELKFSYARSSGKGGQSVNKTNTKATLVWNLNDSASLDIAHKKRFKERYSSQISEDGSIVIHSQSHRTQTLNKEECIKKLNQMIYSTRFAPKKRKSTRPTKGSVERRIKTKKLKGLTKKLRREKVDY